MDKIAVGNFIYTLKVDYQLNKLVKCFSKDCILYKAFISTTVLGKVKNEYFCILGHESHQF